VSGKLLVLIGGCLAFGLLVALPARHLGGGDVAVVYAGTAMFLCLLPAAATLAWAQWAFRQDPQQQLTAVLGASGIRIFAVMLAAFTLYSYLPFYREQAGFWIWLIVFYLFTLALEMTLLLAGRREPAQPPARIQGD
jgi:hypothetical protein